MWSFRRLFSKEDGGACSAFEARLEDHLEALDESPRARPDAALAAHLESCAPCRDALAYAREASVLVRDHAIAVPESLADDPFFANRVTARIRENAQHAGDFWPQLEKVSIRLVAYAMSLAILLGALTASGVTRTQQPTAARNRAGVRTVSFDSNPAPVNPDDVVMAVLTTEQGRQR